MAETRSEFIKAAQSNGWRLYWANRSDLMFQCGHHGCPETIRIGDWSQARIPDECQKEHINGFTASAIFSYYDLVGELRRKRHLLGLSQEDLAFAAGFADGHINKLEADARTAVLPTLIVWASALGYDLALVPAPVPDAVIRMIDRKAGRSAPDAGADTAARSAAPASDH